MAWDLRLAGVGKKYRVRRARTSRPLLEWSPPADDFWALRDVSFEVAPGEVLGVIGANGAGKSTLLKVLSRITAPSEGEIRIRGRLAALIEVGSGFHPELTGRENVFLSGTILGMRRRDIAARLDSIVEFSGVGTYFDMPVKWYSSGMYVRLGFSVAAHLEPDILLVDEVLAVGDASFQARCLRRIQELRHRGTTIVFISHDLGSVERLCSRAILLKQGRIAAEGSARDVVTTYQRMVEAEEVAAIGRFENDEATNPRITALTVDGPGGAAAPVASGTAISIEVGLRQVGNASPVTVQAMIYGYDHGVLLCECTTGPQGVRLPAGDSVVRFDIPELPLLPASYTLGATVTPVGSPRAIDWWFGRTTLIVEDGPRSRGHFVLPYRWSVAAPGAEVSVSRR